MLEGIGGGGDAGVGILMGTWQPKLSLIPEKSVNLITR